MVLSPEYRIWQHIKKRCLNSTNHAYNRYGGRGITVCDRWKDSFEDFYADMGNRPGPAYSIERKNNDGPYDKTNCVWATVLVQNRNKSSNRLLTFDERTQCLQAWADEWHIKADTLSMRLKRRWSIEKALTTPVRPMKRKHA